MKSLSLTLRISLLFATVVVAVMLTTGYFLARAVEGHFLEIDRHKIEGKLELICHLIEQGDDGRAMDRLPKQIEDALVGHPGLSVAVMNADNSVWFATPDANFPPTMLRAPRCPTRQDDIDCLPNGIWQWRHEERNYRGKMQSVVAGNGERQGVVVAVDIGHHEVFMARFRLTLGLALALAAVTTTGLGWFATYRGLVPLRRFSELAAGISAEHLKIRLPQEGNPPELRGLAQSFNEMLTRLDSAFGRLSEFSADLAHELRTPISNLQTQTQVTLSRTRTAKEYREALQSSAEEYERLARMISDMLFLAKADNRLLVPQLERFEVADEVRRLVDYHGILAEEQAIGLKITGSVTLKADRLMLRRALSNLLSNAIRHCPPGGTVTIRLGSDASGASIVVENPGTIAGEHLPRLFERFYTGDPARRGRSGGIGLGLAIVRSIVEAHAGEITADSSAGLTRFVIRLPASSAVCAPAPVHRRRSHKAGPLLRVRVSAKTAGVRPEGS